MLTEPAQIRHEGNLPDVITDEKLNPHLDKAVIEMKRILTTEKYEEILALDNDNDDRLTCAIAEANLAMSYAVTTLNIETSGTGIVRSKGFDESRSDLLSQNEVEKLRNYYRNIAMDLLRPFIPQEVGTDDDPADVVRGSDYSITAL